MTFAYGDVLAGPIVRRVEPTLAAVWIALRKPARVTLRIFEGIRSGDTTDAPLATAEVETLALGAELHLALPMMDEREQGGSRLRSDRIYAYDVVLRERGADAAEGQGLQALGLLDDGEIDGRPRLALGFQPGRLPASCCRRPTSRRSRCWSAPAASPTTSAPTACRTSTSCWPGTTPISPPRSGRTSCSSPATRSTPTTSRRSCSL